MFKQSIAILFLFAFLTQMFSKAIIVCSFYANQDYIAKNLCENRKKPRSCCEGKCQLKKKLNKETNEDKQNDNRKSGKDTEVLSATSFFSHDLIPDSKNISIPYSAHKSDKPIDRSYTIFHPPGV